LGGAIAALILFIIKANILFKADKVTAAKKWVPIMVAIMAAAFSMYLMSKGLKKIYKSSWLEIVIVGTLVCALTWTWMRSRVALKAVLMENKRKSVNQLFVVPLIFSAALLSFAHGANDVANAVGPLAAIVSVADTGQIASKASIPLWVMLVGALGISIGLVLFGSRLIKTVGQEITKLNPVRAFCVALSAAITVIIASTLGLPVSSTHIAVGGVFGVGFLREYLELRKANQVSNTTPLAATAAAPEKAITKARQRRLVRRNHAWSIAAAWIITVPLAAILAAGLFHVLVMFNVTA
jgi:PiT family inorganic phosphate transporter